MFELRCCRGAAGDESGEARAEMMFELRRNQPAAGVAVRAEGRSPEMRAEWISGEARAE
jgi:hypothetical protein